MPVIDKNYAMDELGIKYGFLDGEFLPWRDCKVHMYTNVVRYGFRTFEGLRGYWNDEHKQLYLFRLADHLDRLFESNKLMAISIPYTKEDIANITVELCRKNEFQRDCYIQPSPYIGMGGLMSFSPDTAFMGLMVAALPTRSSEGKDTGQKACVSSWRRTSDGSQPPRIKAGSNYLNVRLARMQYAAGGFDTAILLSDSGKVAEGPGSNIIMVRKGVPATPAITNDILEGITRDTLACLLRTAMGMHLVERDIDRTELYLAEEVFLCGTAAEIIPVTSIDGLPVGNGKRGPVTKELQNLYFATVRGKKSQYQEWLTPVYD